MIWMLVGALLIQDPSDATGKVLESKKTSFEIEDKPLTEFVEYLNTETRWPVHFFLDAPSIPKAGAILITYKSNPVPIAKLLSDITQPKKLEWTICEGVVVITTPKGKADFDRGAIGGPRSEDLKKNAPLWDRLSRKVEMESRADLADAVARLASESGVKIQAGRLGRRLEQKVRLRMGSQTILAHLRILCRAFNLAFEVKGEDIVLKLK